jgi:hypothetical protein
MPPAALLIIGLAVDVVRDAELLNTDRAALLQFVAPAMGEIFGVVGAV